MSLEAVFALIFSIIVGYDSLTGRTLLGFVVVFAGTTVARLGSEREPGDGGRAGAAGALVSTPAGLQAVTSARRPHRQTAPPATARPGTRSRHSAPAPRSAPRPALAPPFAARALCSEWSPPCTTYSFPGWSSWSSSGRSSPASQKGSCSPMQNRLGTPIFLSGSVNRRLLVARDDEGDSRAPPSPAATRPSPSSPREISSAAIRPPSDLPPMKIGAPGAAKLVGNVIVDAPECVLQDRRGIRRAGAALHVGEVEPHHDGAGLLRQVRARRAASRGWSRSLLAPCARMSTGVSGRGGRASPLSP